MSFDENFKALLEARKVSPDWQGISVLMSLTTFGASSLRGEPDGACINAMSPERRAKAAGLFRTYLALNQGVKELHDEIENELRESIK